MRSLSCVILALMITGIFFVSLMQTHHAWQEAGAAGLVSINLPIDETDYSSLKVPNRSSISTGPQQDLSAKPETHQMYSVLPSALVFDGLTTYLADYLPASMLTERPVVLKDIDSELLASHWLSEAKIIRCLLLINEYGDVDRVEMESSGLSAQMQSVLRQRFLAARFSPGKLDGSAVRVALRIQVQLHE